MIKLKPCPFCGSKVELEKRPLWRDSHGYFGCYEFVIECKNPECLCQIYLKQNDTIYREEKEAKENTIRAWNKRA